MTRAMVVLKASRIIGLITTAMIATVASTEGQRDQRVPSDRGVADPAIDGPRVGIRRCSPRGTSSVERMQRQITELRATDPD